MAIHIRPAIPGDYCVLLAPAADDAARLSALQQSLLIRCGGTPTDPVHLTCQRFAAGPEALESLVDLMHAVMLAAQPIEIVATALVKWHPPGQRKLNLRWGIELTSEVRSFNAMLDRGLAASGSAPMYVAGWQPTMVTALEGIDDISFDPNQLSVEEFPYVLFQASRVLITRILGNDRYQTEAELVIG